MHERLTLILLNEAMVFTSVNGPSAKMAPGTRGWARLGEASVVHGVAEPSGEKGGLEMSCQRCGGILAAELAAAMYELVCGRVVIENRYCHCDDVEGPVQVDLPREERAALAGDA